MTAFLAQNCEIATEIAWQEVSAIETRFCTNSVKAALEIQEVIVV
jgi:hypothetical protein